MCSFCMRGSNVSSASLSRPTTPPPLRRAPPTGSFGDSALARAVELPQRIQGPECRLATRRERQPGMVDLTGITWASTRFLEPRRCRFATKPEGTTVTADAPMPTSNAGSTGPSDAASNRPGVQVHRLSWQDETRAAQVDNQQPRTDLAGRGHQETCRSFSYCLSSDPGRAIAAVATYGVEGMYCRGRALESAQIPTRRRRDADSRRSARGKRLARVP